MMTDNVSIFKANVTEIISGAINTGIDGVDANREGWAKFEAELVNLIVAEAQRALFQSQVHQHDVPVAPKVKTKAAPKSKGNNESESGSGSGTGTGTGGKPIYSQWVKGITRIRHGEVQGDDMVTIGNHFTSKTSKSIDKYNHVKDTLDLEGQEMSVKSLMERLKSCAGLSGEREVTLTAIAWGLIPAPRREELALKYVK